MDAGEEPAERADLAVERDVGLGVTRLRPRPELGGRADRIAPQRDSGAVGGRGERHHLRLDGVEAARAQPEIANDVIAKAANAVGDRRAHAGRDLLGREQTACTSAPLEDERPEPRFREVRGRDQTVVAASDDDRVVSLPCHAQAAFLARSERRTCSAARRPEAPMIPPPGCVAEPHIQRFRSGVR